jgi:DNA uptake protein ComE-like DNA-binding protein
VRPIPVVSGFVVASLLTLAACNSGGSNSAASTTSSSSAAASGASAGAKANANTASVDELTNALSAAGVSNASRWAQEVEEYRPYPTSDATFAKLRQSLAKYNPGDDVVEKIVGALSL